MLPKYSPVLLSILLVASLLSSQPILLLGIEREYTHNSSIAISQDILPAHSRNVTYNPLSPYGICAHVPNEDVLDMIAECGINWIRIDMTWYRLEPTEDGYNWGYMDNVVDMAVERNLSIFATLAYTPSWASGVNTSVDEWSAYPPTSTDYWTDFVTHVVNRYKDKIHHWGMWNEPNLDGFWKGSRQDYIDIILKPGSDAVKAADPTAKVLGPELAHLQSGEYDQWLADVLDQAASKIDIITHHVYKDTPSEVLRELEGPKYPWETPPVKDIIDAHGGSGKEFWLTETGWHTDKVSQDEQAQYYTELLDYMNSRTWWYKTFFYEIRDDPNISSKWGIIESDNTPKQAYYAYQDYITSHAPDSPPIVEILSPVNGTNVRAPIQLTWRASDVNNDIISIEIYDGASHLASLPPTTTCYNISSVLVGWHTFSVEARDQGGHISKDAITVNVVQEKTMLVHQLFNPITIDGDLSEWVDAKVASLNSSDYHTLTTDTNGDSDISADLYAQWDATTLYFALEVQDDVHYNDEPASMLWDGDSVQFAMDLDHDRTPGAYDNDSDYEIGIAMDNSGGVMYALFHEPEGVHNFSPELVVTRSGSKTIYEMAIPANQLPPLSLEDGGVIGFSFVVNDDDGNGREGWLEWTEGIGESKNPAMYGDMLFEIRNRPPEVLSQPDPITINEDEVVDNALDLISIFSDPDGDVLTYSTNRSSPSDGNVLVDVYNGKLRITPDRDWNGVDVVKISACDGTNPPVSASLVIHVLPVNDPPSIDSVNGYSPRSIPTLNTPQESEIVLDVYARDPDLTREGDTLTYNTDMSNIFERDVSIEAEVDHATIKVVPGPWDVGEHTIKIWVSDSHNATDTASITIDVINVNDPPEILDINGYNATDAISLVYYEDEWLNITVNATDPDLPYQDVLQYETNSSLFYFKDMYNGTISTFLRKEHIGEYMINITVSDSYGEKAYAIIHLTVIHVNHNITRGDIIILDAGPYYEGDIIGFEASGFLDIDGESIEYTWLVDGTEAGKGWMFNYTSTAGVHNITLIVSDGHGSNITVSRNVTVREGVGGNGNGGGGGGTGDGDGGGIEGNGTEGEGGMGGGSNVKSGAGAGVWAYILIVTAIIIAALVGAFYFMKLKAKGQDGGSGDGENPRRP